MSCYFKTLIVIIEVEGTIVLQVQVRITNQCSRICPNTPEAPSSISYTTTNLVVAPHIDLDVAVEKSATRTSVVALLQTLAWEIPGGPLLIQALDLA